MLIRQLLFLDISSPYWSLKNKGEVNVRNLPNVLSKAVFIFFLAFLTANTIGFARGTVDDEVTSIIDGYSKGILSRESRIKVVFTESMVLPEAINHPLGGPLFTFHPKIKGKSIWTDTNTLEFIPDSWMKKGQPYISILNLSSLRKELSGESFKFEFSTYPMSFDIETERIKATHRTFPDLMSLKGRIITSDVVSNENVIKVVSAMQNGKDLTIVWTHLENHREHRFNIKGIERKKNLSHLLIKWNGRPH